MPQGLGRREAIILILVTTWIIKWVTCLTSNLYIPPGGAAASAPPRNVIRTLNERKSVLPWIITLTNGTSQGSSAVLNCRPHEERWTQLPMYCSRVAQCCGPGGPVLRPNAVAQATEQAAAGISRSHSFFTWDSNSSARLHAIKDLNSL